MLAEGVIGCAAIEADLLDSNFGPHVVQKALKELKTEKIYVIVNNAAFVHISSRNDSKESSTTSTG